MKNVMAKGVLEMFIGEKPKTLEECFERLKKGCQRLSDECGYSDDYSIFNEPATEEEIKRYEESHDIVLPEDYKKFLRFSNGAIIMDHWMKIYGLDYCGISDEMVPEYYYVIGEQVGDGERIAFDLETKEIFSFYDGSVSSWRIEDEMKSLLEACEEKIIESEEEKAWAAKDPETLKKEECTSNWRKLIEEKKKERGIKND
ncbi:MAG: SMI1/KNR4 family protein [Oscillospiraceae bacterium]|nr:SMI1/KNR4 family protein [Oscillospiraceae bacterium]MBR6834808.1 SMI1/KNR4 family protein [Oscillospiraceae bacterium]